MRAIILALLLSGCAAIDRAYDKARWTYDGFEVATYTWTVTELRMVCGLDARNTNNFGCAVRVRDAAHQAGAKPVPGTKGTSGHCFIFSNVSEEDAKRIGTTHGDSLFDHEVRHCRGWAHAEKK